MAKKNRQKLQRLIKKQHLHSLQTTATPAHSPVAASITPATHISEPVIQTRPTAIGGEWRRTLASLVIIIILLGVSYWVDERTPYFAQFGEWLYRTLRLAS